MFSYIHRKKTIYRALVFIFIYFNALFTFAVIYILLDMMNLGSLNDHYASPMHQEQPLDLITRSLYFSAITLLSVGYGDVTPFGLARAFAIIEALFGYLLPVIIVIQFLPHQNHDENEYPMN
ncbi:potassium channel family protein [Ferdinandcohnia quinoae]|uniref:Ion channel n=1 Tax=Fredinandcohnia quinoae TaxID=2918902 RepID=A0AAW5EDW7_9BACI|nr:potassium channel family protein [Fredinandcohnia sp. SECRCQ15]MCH1627656.1 ion channel [Fredinandcohnia sp. SECRCQ15]